MTYLCKFLPKLSDACEPLRKLTLKDTTWWSSEVHDQAFENVKHLVSRAPALKYSDPEAELILQGDASEMGLGEVITQNRQPVAFASRALTDVET